MPDLNTHIKHLASSIALLAALTATTAYAETPSVVSAENWAQTQENSLTLKRAERTLNSAGDALGVTVWDETRITASGQANNLLNDDLETQYSASLNLSVPVTNTVSFGATLTSEQNVTLSASYSPFASATITPQMTLTYDKAVISLASTQSDLFSELESAELNYRLANRNAELAAETLALTQQETSVITAKLSAGEATTADLLDAQKAESEAQQSYFSSQVSLIEASQALQQLLGVESLDMAELSFDDLSALVTSRQETLATLSGTDITSSNLATLKAELKALESEANDLDWFASDLTFTAEYDVEQATAKAGVSINLSPSQFQQDEIVDAELDINLKQMEIRSEVATLTLQHTILMERIDIQRAALDAAITDQTARHITLDETRYLGSLGERTNLEVSQAELNAAQADAQVYSALVNVYLAQSELLALYSNP